MQKEEEKNTSGKTRGNKRKTRTSLPPDTKTKGRTGAPSHDWHPRPRLWVAPAALVGECRLEE